MLAKEEDFPSLLSPCLWRAVSGSLKSPILGFEIDLSFGPRKSGIVKWAETHLLPVPFPVSCEEHVWVCGSVLHRHIRARLSSGGEEGLGPGYSQAFR